MDCVFDLHIFVDRNRVAGHDLMCLFLQRFQCPCIFRQCIYIRTDFLKDVTIRDDTQQFLPEPEDDETFSFQIFFAFPTIVLVAFTYFGGLGVRGLCTQTSHRRSACHYDSFETFANSNLA